MAQTRGAPIKPEKDMVRHMVINALRGFNIKFKEKYGEMVLCSDASDPWRREIFPLYKHKRRKGRDDSATDWKQIFEIISDIKNEIAENFPYKVMYIENAEADDIIATLVSEQKENVYLIISGDKDFIQLQHYGNVYQWSPLLKGFIGEQEDPKKFLHEQIIKGDRADGIPNILSADNVFEQGIRQKPINTKRLEEWSNLNNIPLGSETRKYYERNKKLIDLSMIPENIKSDVINKYKTYKVVGKDKLLPYFIQNKLKTLMENIGDF
jgi:hypothetical protein